MADKRNAPEGGGRFEAVRASFGTAQKGPDGRERRSPRQA
jgi:hypothetical protein